MIFSVILLAVSLSIDALGAGIAYGLRGIRIPIIPKLVICAFSIIYSLCAIYAGKILASILPGYTAKIIGASILLIMGLWIIIQATIKKQENGSNRPEVRKYNQTMIKFGIKSLGITVQIIRDPLQCDLDKSGTIDMREAALLGLALSVDAIGAGIGCAFTGFHSIYIPFVIGLFQLVSLYIGTYTGSRFHTLEKINKRAVSIAPGLLLILLAALRIF